VRRKLDFLCPSSTQKKIVGPSLSLFDAASNQQRKKAIFAFIVLTIYGAAEVETIANNSKQ
jgi:hypothetical protein